MENGCVIFNNQNNLTYRKRYIRRLLSIPIIVDIILTAFFFSCYIQCYNAVLLLFSTIFLILSILNIKIGIQECRFFITRISIENKQLCVYYNEGNISKHVIIPMSNITLKIFHRTRGVGICYTTNLRFYENKRIILKQYTLQDWTLRTMQSVAQKIEELKKEYEQEHTNTNKH